METISTKAEMLEMEVKRIFLAGVSSLHIHYDGIFDNKVLDGYTLEIKFDYVFYSDLNLLSDYGWHITKLLSYEGKIMVLAYHFKFKEE